MRVALAAILLTTTRTYADERPPRPTDEHTAAEVAHAPFPGEESGRSDDGDHDSPARDIAQALLSVPRYVIEGAMAPVRGGLWVYERYRLGRRVNRLASAEANAYSLYPTLHVNTDYGATLGGRFVHRDLFGGRERLTARAGFGGEVDALVAGGFTTGERFARVALEVHGELERRPRDRFYGIGNADDAMEASHRQQLARGSAALVVAAQHDVHVRLASAVTDVAYAAASEGPAIDAVYDPALLTGFTGTRNVYSELELRWDTRGVANDLAHHGALVDAFIGRVHQLAAGGDYWRYGGDVVHFLPLGVGRSLATRLHVEAVTGSLDDVAFTQLPQLGGMTLLRGYPTDRFRDRAAVLGSAEYVWDLSSFVLASLFVDAGRVYPSLADLSADHVRFGYGASLQLLRRRRFLAGVSVASSREGDLFFNLVLDPVYERPARVDPK